MEDREEVPHSWLPPGPAWATAVTWEECQHTEKPFLLSLSASSPFNSTLQVNTKIFKKIQNGPINLNVPE